jgi:hypothetical protein
MRCGRDAESNRNGARVCNRSLQITEPLRPATILLLKQACQGSNPDQRGWSSRCFRLHHRPVQSGRPGSNGPLPGWRPGALPSELRPRSGTPGWSRTSGLCRRRTALSPLSYGRRKNWSLRQESNPHLGRTKGACLPLTLRRRSGDGRSRTDIFLVASEALVRLSYFPEGGADGWSRTTTARGDRVTAC